MNIGFLKNKIARLLMLPLFDVRVLKIYLLMFQTGLILRKLSWQAILILSNGDIVCTRLFLNMKLAIL